jgi:hypothetical protein
MHRLTTASVNAPLIQIQQQECKGIEGLSGKLALRLKVGGDTPSAEYAEGLAKSCEIYTAKHGQPAYGYTHNWHNIPRQAFGQISMLASCDTVAEISEAKALGYATATVVSSFPNGPKAFDIDGNKVIPCPNQTARKDKPIQCVDCRLCFNDSKLISHNITIGFVAHGRKSEDLKVTLGHKGL